MARIAGVNLPDTKRADIGLTAIYGVGRRNAKTLLKKAQVDPAKKVVELTSEELIRITKLIEEVPIEGTLRKQVSESIKRLKVIGAYRGLRHNQGLPSRGQRTRSNARTKRGKRQTVGAMRKKEMSRTEGAKKEKEKKDA